MSIVRNVDTPATLAVELVAIVALLLRQLIVLLDNQRLTRDVMAQQEELAHRAFHDPLTGLANRALFFDRVSHALDLHRRDLRPVSVIFVDLDDFKSINDAFGHETGDVVLTEVAGRLEDASRTGDTVARLGGDEFAILLEDSGDPGARRATVAGRAPGAGPCRRPARPGTGQRRQHHAWTSAPTSTTRTNCCGRPTSPCTPRSAAARTPWSATCRACVTPARTTWSGASHCRRTSPSGRLATVFQPIVRTTSGELYAMEALARWQFRGKSVSPAEFIPLADRGGFLDDLDLVVAGRALALAEAVPYRGAPILLSTNIALRHHGVDLVDRFAELLALSSVDASRLVIEVSEQDALDDAASAATLAQLRELGMQLAIDDFGVGYSNLARLETVRPDILKLDRSLIAPLASGSARRPAGTGDRAGARPRRGRRRRGRRDRGAARDPRRPRLRRAAGLLDRAACRIRRRRRLSATVLPLRPGRRR